jgi:DnaJ homolog subfamily C member 28
MSDQTDRQRRIREEQQRAFENLIDRRFRAAEAEGLLRDLPGAGRPLPPDEALAVPEDLRTGFRLLRGAGYAPAWIELQKELRAEQARVAQAISVAVRRWPELGPRDRTALREELVVRLRELNSRTLTYNLSAPPAAGQFPLLQIEQELRGLEG